MSPRRPTSPPIGSAIDSAARRPRRPGCIGSSSTRPSPPCAAVDRTRRRPDLSPFITPDTAAGTTSRLALFDALDGLSPRHRAAVILRYYHDYDYATIAQILGTTVTNVGAMLSRALDRLKVALDRNRARRKARGSHEDRLRPRSAAPQPPSRGARSRAWPRSDLGRIAGLPTRGRAGCRAGPGGRCASWPWPRLSGPWGERPCWAERHLPPVVSLQRLDRVYRWHESGRRRSDQTSGSWRSTKRPRRVIGTDTDVIDQLCPPSHRTAEASPTDSLKEPST